MKTRIDMQQIRDHLAFRAYINALDLNEVEIVDNGQVIEVPPEVIEEWRFIGMSNISFYEMEFWKDENHETLDGSRDG